MLDNKGELYIHQIIEEEEEEKIFKQTHNFIYYDKDKNEPEHIINTKEYTSEE